MALRGKIAFVNLSTKEVNVVPTPERPRRLYLGARGRATHLIYNHVDMGTGLLGPSNALVISACILKGTVAPATARVHI